MGDRWIHRYSEPDIKRETHINVIMSIIFYITSRSIEIS